MTTKYGISYVCKEQNKLKITFIWINGLYSLFFVISLMLSLPISIKPKIISVLFQQKNQQECIEFVLNKNECIWIACKLICEIVMF